MVSDFHLGQTIDLRPFSPPPWESDDDRVRSMLCPIRALKVYLGRTEAHRRTDQLFVCFRQDCLGRRLSKSRLSHWIVETIEQAYRGLHLPAFSGVRAHSTRGVAVSWAVLRGASLAEICAAAAWSTPSTFSRFYSLNVAAGPSFGERVLGVLH